MAYNIGQKRKSDISEQTNILTSVSATPSSYSSAIVEGEGESGALTNCLIPLSGTGCYYLYGKIKRMIKADIPLESKSSFIGQNGFLNNNSNLQYDIYLGEYSNNEFTAISQLRDNYLVNSIKGDNQGENTLETILLVFNVENEHINAILFELVTNRVDYILDPANNPRNGWLLKNGKFSFGLYSVNNIVSGLLLSKIGVRTRPGQIIIINKEPIRVGKSGLYLVYTGAKVNFFSIVAASMINSNYQYDSNGIPDFILDYVIKKETTTTTTTTNSSGSNDNNGGGE